MKITSDAIGTDGRILRRYTCDGDGTSPPLAFSGIPDKAESSVLILEDPDAPNGTFTHWLLYDIPPIELQLAEGRMPLTGIAGMNDFGQIGYGGPCPPSGTHRYIFRLFVLDTVLDLPEGASRRELLDAMEGHVIDTAELASTYTRSRDS